MATFFRMNRKVLYWVCQLTWSSLYLILGIVRVGGSFGQSEVIFLLAGTSYLLVSTHLFRYFIHRRKWIKLYLSKLLPRVLGAIVVLTLSYYVFFSLVLYADYKLGPEETTQEESIEPIIDSLGLAYEASQGSLPLDSASILNPEQNPVDEEAEQVTMFDLVLDPVNVISIMSTGLIVYFIWSTIYFMFHYVESYNQTLKYEATINEIELNKLKSQLNPHFIFNALNSIRALVDEDPRKSKIAITQLSTILRNSLIMDKKRLIPFTEEMVTVKDYLALETIRFEERLQTDFKLHPESYRFEVPPLMVQTLVENAIKHGISNLAAGGEVIVETVLLKEEDKLAIRIHNSGQYVNGQPRKGTGYGIENTKQRLRLIFGQEASFSISNESADKVLTEVVIPVKP